MQICNIDFEQNNTDGTKYDSKLVTFLLDDCVRSNNLGPVVLVFVCSTDSWRAILEISFFERQSLF